MTGKLGENIVHFARALRAAGMPVGPASVVEAMRAVEIAGLDSRRDLYWTLHALFVSKRDHRAVYDAVFRQFWRSRGLLDPSLPMPMPAPARAPEKPKAADSRAAAAMTAGVEPKRIQEEETEIDARYTTSGEDVLKRRDFAQMSAAEMAEAKRRIAALRMPRDRIATRRFVPDARPGRIDARRTIRQSLRSGGKLILPRYHRPRETLPPLVALVDISGSMSQYSRILLHFLHAIGHQRRVHSFVFGTRLTNITRSLRLRDPDEALAACSDQVQDWSGGTRIAAALHDFNRLWSRRVLGQGAIVLLLTDGLERDDGEDLAVEMDRLHRSCRSLIWLNPLLRFDRFEAKARGIRAMLPHVDAFRTVHSLESMEELCAALAGGDAVGTDPRAWLDAA